MPQKDVRLMKIIQVGESLQRGDAVSNDIIAIDAALKEMGLDLTSSVNLLAQMEANGVDTTTAIAGLKKAVANATKEGKSADQALAETIASIKNASSETEALSDAALAASSPGSATIFLTRRPA